MDYIIDGILPTRSVHLLGGASGSSKTTFLLQLIDKLRTGGLLLGRKVTPTSFAYISFDRSTEEVHRSCDRIGIEYFPMWSVADLKDGDKPGLKEFPELVDVLEKNTGAAKVIIVEAVEYAVSNFNAPREVARFLITLQHIASVYGLTFILTTHSPKEWEGETVINPRQRLIGTVTWAEFASTVFVMASPSKTERKMFILPRDAAEEEVTFTLDDHGRLVEEKEQGLEFMKEFLEYTDRGIVFTRQDVVRFFESRYSPSTVDRALASLLESGKLSKAGYGKYTETTFQ